MFKGVKPFVINPPVISKLDQTNLGRSKTAEIRPVKPAPTFSSHPVSSFDILSISSIKGSTLSFISDA